MRRFGLFLTALLATAQSLTSTIDGQASITIVPFTTAVTFSIGNATPNASGVAVLELSAVSSRRPAGILGFDLTLPAGLKEVRILPGPALPAGVVPNCQAADNPNVRRCAILSLGGLAEFASGVVARLSINTAGAALPATVVLSNVTAGLPTGESLQAALAPGGGVIGATAPAVRVQSATCTTPPYDAAANLPPGTWRLEPGETLRCTATLTAPAPPGGYTAAITADPRLKVSAISVAGGQTTAPFTIALQ